MPLAHQRRVTFAVPLTIGQYAPERITFGENILGVSALVESGVTGAVVEVWLLRVDGDPATDAHYVNTGMLLSGSAVGHERMELAEWVGVQLRVKSGGTTGNLTLSASVDR